MTSVRILTGDCLDVLPTLDAESVQCVVTSPPYFGLRDYKTAGQLGLETVGLVAHRLGRDFVGIELNADYALLATRRIRDDAPLFAGEPAI